ncbi:metallophosphoesterase [Schlesneria sp.]|uniref:metallophosphoesterase n=1 Tax=Schlesneria sp. TaxID=2762018 RepID=UPI002F1B3FAA
MPLNHDISSADSSRQAPPVTRRHWLRRVAGSFVAGTAGVGYYSLHVEPHWIEVVHRPLPIRGLPAELENRTLVQISDVHIGHEVDDRFLIQAFQQVSEWAPDLVVFTGDFLTLHRDGSLPIKKMERVLKHFPQGKLATLGILGNHDYGHQWNDLSAASVVARIAEDAGIQILRNRSKFVRGLQIVGFDDYWGPNFGGPRVLADSDFSLPTLILCHNPDVVDLPVWYDYRGWILSGHTHGGQVKPPWFGPPILPIGNKRYAAGEISLEDGRHLYVNRALGHSMRVRINVRPELTVFRLVREESA